MLDLQSLACIALEGEVGGEFYVAMFNGSLLSGGSMGWLILRTDMAIVG